MTMDDVREYEKNMHEQTNIKVCNQHSSTVDAIESHAQTSVCRIFKTCCPPFYETYTSTDLWNTANTQFSNFHKKCHCPEAVGKEPELGLNWTVSPLASRHFDSLKPLDLVGCGHKTKNTESGNILWCSNGLACTIKEQRGKIRCPKKTRTSRQ